MESLEEIGFRFGTDKSTLLHDYLHFYESRLEKHRSQDFLLVEIGVYQGSSLRMWREYFPNARIVGVDIDPQAEQYAQSGVVVEIADASRAEETDRIVAKHGAPLIVLDDGSHFCSHQISTFQHLWRHIAPGGVFIMEDIHTSFLAPHQGWLHGSPVSTYDYLQRLNTWVVAHDSFETTPETDSFIQEMWPSVRSIEWRSHTAMIYKKDPKEGAGSLRRSGFP